jgi:hypothetical protein
MHAKFYDYDVFRFLDLLELDYVQSFPTKRFGPREVRNYIVHKNVSSLNGNVSFEMSNDSVADFELNGYSLSFWIYWFKKPDEKITILLNDNLHSKIQKYFVKPSHCEGCEAHTETYIDICYNIIVCKNCNCTK